MMLLTQVYAEMSGRENGSNDLMQLRYALCFSLTGMRC